MVSFRKETESYRLVSGLSINQGSRQHREHGTAPGLSCRGSLVLVLPQLGTLLHRDSDIHVGRLRSRIPRLSLVPVISHHMLKLASSAPSSFLCEGQFLPCHVDDLQSRSRIFLSYTN